MASITHLVLPGLDGSGPRHWQTRWEEDLADFKRVELGDWAQPDRTAWTERLDDAIAGHGGAPIVLVAHSLGCLLVSWWAQRFGDAASRVKGAMLVAPCDTEICHDPRLARYGSWPERYLPFPSLLIASSNDPYTTGERSAELARRFGADFVNLGPMGHINADSGLDSWELGQALLRQFELSFINLDGYCRASEAGTEPISTRQCGRPGF